jgi:N-carbamoylputrescine amidase
MICALAAVAASAAENVPHPGLRVAMCQTEIVDGDLAENVRRAEDAIRKAAKERADLICLPEAADWGWLYKNSRRDAFPIPGYYTDLLSRLAEELKVWICAGCLERGGDKTYNSAVLIDRTGKIVLKHRKIDVLKFLTKKLYDPGVKEDIKAVDTEFGRVGVTICADNFTIANPKRVAELGAWLLIAPHGFAAEEDKLEQNGKSFQEHIRNVAGKTKMWVIGTDTVLGPVKSGAWKGQPHSGCSTIARPDGTAAVVGKFKQTDMVVFDIPAGG